MKKMLSEISTIKSGQILTRISAEKTKEEVIGKQKVIIPKAISNGALINDQLSDVEISKQPDIDKFAKKGDIIIKLTTPYDSAIILEEDENLLVSSFCGIVRPNEEIVNPKYLIAFLNTNYVKEHLKSKVEGLVRPMLKLYDLSSLEVPILSVEKMNHLGKAFLLSCDKKKVLSKMLETEERIMESTILQSIKEVF